MSETSLVSKDELQHILRDSPFLQSYGFVVESCAAGVCTVRVPFHPALERPGGVVSGITIMAAADVTMWLAIMTLRGVAEHWVTTDMKTAFLRGARQSDMFCTATILKLGKRTAYGSSECKNESGELLAHHVISYANSKPIAS